MRIALVLFEMNSEFGGLLSWILNMAEGLRENGHTPVVYYARPSVHPEFYIRELGGESQVIHEKYGLIIRVHASGGRGKLIAEDKIVRSYRGKAASAFKEELQDYDGVILVWPPSYGDSSLRKHPEWAEAMKHGRPMVAVAHDCHWLRIYPWILNIRDRIDYLVGVHPAAYDSIKNWPGRIANIFNPFDISPAKIHPVKFHNAVCNTAFFKKWKHNEDGIRASMYLDPMHIFYVGGGIELTNMQAEFTDRAHLDKNRKYYWNAGDQDSKADWIWSRIWDVAEENGNFHYLGLQSPSYVKEVQRWCIGLTEFAYHPKWGEHWNRALIEAMIHRCIPFCRPTGAIGKKVKKENVVLIPEDAGPKLIADIIKDACKDAKLYNEITQRNVKEILPDFDRRIIAEKYVRLLQGKNPHAFQGPEEGKPDKKVQTAFRDFPQRFARTNLFPRLR